MIWQVNHLLLRKVTQSLVAWSLGKEAWWCLHGLVGYCNVPRGCSCVI